MQALEAWQPKTPGLLEAVADFVPLARDLPFGSNDFEGSTPIATPKIGQLKAVACVHAPPHQDLPYPRWSVLAPVIVRPNARLSVQGASGSRSMTVSTGEIIILDAHAVHSLSKPDGWPEDEELEKMEPSAKEALKRAHMSVFFNYDTPVRPSREQAEAMFAKLLHVAPVRQLSQRLRMR